MRQVGQKMRFNDNELSMIKGLFADNDPLIFAIRNVLFQFPIDDHERSLISEITNPMTTALLRKFFLPDLDPGAPLFQLTDMYLGLQSDMKTLLPDQMEHIIKAKELEIAYLDQQLGFLFDIKTYGGVPELVFADLVKGHIGEKAKIPSNAAKWVGILARNYLLSFVDSSMQQIKFLAGLKEETVEETKDRLAKDSNQ